MTSVTANSDSNRSAKAGRRFLLVLLFASTLLVALVIKPFVGALFAAAVFATVLVPAAKRTSAALGNRPRVAAAAVVLALTLVAFVPLAYVCYVGSQQVVSVVGTAVERVKTDGIDGLIADLPEGMQALARRLSQALPMVASAKRTDSSEELTDAARATNREQKQEASGGATEGETLQQESAANEVDFAAVIGTTAKITKDVGAWLFSLAIDLGVLVVALFFMLVQGKDLVSWIVDASPLPNKQTSDFVSELKDVTVAVFTSTILTAFIQTAIAVLGYVVAGTPMLLMVTLLTLVAAFIPAVGAASVVIIIGAMTIANGSMAWGIALIAWGFLPVALSDNFLKPMLAQGRLRLPNAVLFFAMLGGLALMGPMGVIGGPLAVSFFLVVVRALKERGSPRAVST